MLERERLGGEVTQRIAEAVIGLEEPLFFQSIHGEAISLSLKNVGECKGGPFAAVVAMDGEIMKLDY